MAAALGDPNARGTGNGTGGGNGDGHGAGNGPGNGPGRLGCPDPVVGTWRSNVHQWYRWWQQMTLRIRRENGELRGSIENREWGLNAFSGPEPGGACVVVGNDYTWAMRARGHLDGEQLDFGASGRPVLLFVRCGTSRGIYYADCFSGRLDRAHDCFDAVWNDDHYKFDDPVSFHRVSCGQMLRAE